MRGYEHYLALIPEFPEIKTIWRPCEAHPRPETHGPHSDLMIRAFFFLRDNGANLAALHRAMYDAVHKDRIDIENAETLVNYLSEAVDAAGLLAALNDGAYAAELDDANDLAYERSGVWTIPAFRLNGAKLDAKGGVGVTKEQLHDFLKNNKK